VWYNNAWGSVCGENFEDNDAIVACRSMGHKGGSVVSAGTTTDGSGNIWLN
jgi:hypothetical protein